MKLKSLRLSNVRTLLDPNLTLKYSSYAFDLLLIALLYMSPYINMKVSIITVTHNSERFLEDCIRSVAAQSHPDIEYIVIDGNSTDETNSIIKRYEQHIDQWISEPDNGMYDALNKGMKMATGNIVGILNSDDILASIDTIAGIVQCFNVNKVDSIYGDLVYVEQENTGKTIRAWHGKRYNRKNFQYGWMPAHPTFYVRREIIESLGGYETHYYSAADYEFMARYLYNHRVSSFYHPSLIVKMRIGGASNKTIYKRLRANRRDYLAMKVNNIPYPLIVSILKPLIKIPQFINKLRHNKHGNAALEMKPGGLALPSVGA